MFRVPMVVGVLAAMGAGVCAGQAHQGAGGGQTMAQQMVGTWDGTFKSDMGGAGPARLVLERPAGGWKGTFTIEVGHPTGPGDVTDVKIEGNVISWAMKMMNNDCKGEGELKNGTLEGQVDCGQFGLTFSLKKG